MQNFLHLLQVLLTKTENPGAIRFLASEKNQLRISAMSLLLIVEFFFHFFQSQNTWFCPPKTPHSPNCNSGPRSGNRVLNQSPVSGDLRVFLAFKKPHHHVGHEKKNITFHYYTGWLIGILIMVYYNPYIRVGFHPLYNPTNLGFFRGSCDKNGCRTHLVRMLLRCKFVGVIQDRSDCLATKLLTNRYLRYLVERYVF